MLDILRRAFSRQQPRTHLHSLIEDAEKTGDDARLVAETIIKWSWDTHDKKPLVATAGEFVEGLASNGYKPASRLSTAEKQAASPQKIFICQALDSIQKAGYLEAHVGQALREFSEAGQLPTGNFANREPQAFS